MLSNCVAGEDSFFKICFILFFNFIILLGAGALGRPRGMVRGGRREEGSGWGTRVYLWWIHVDLWQNQYNIVKLKNKKKISCSDTWLKEQMVIICAVLTL